MNRGTLLNSVVLMALVGLVVSAAPIPRDPKAEAVTEAVGKLAEAIQKAKPAKPLGEGASGVYLMDLSNGRVTLVGSESDQDWNWAACGAPEWSPDGKRVYYDATPRPAAWTESRIQSIELTGTGLRRSSLGLGNRSSVSPDCKLVASLLNSNDPRERGMRITPADGGAARSLGLYGIPRWSPNGKELLVGQFGIPTTLALMEVAAGAGGDTQSIELAGYQFISFPHWAMENTLVGVVETGGVRSVALVDVSEPGKATVKTTLFKQGDGLPEAVVPTTAAYSRVRGRGVFVGKQPEGTRLYEIEPGKPPRLLEPDRAPGKVTMENIALSPDGRHLLFSDYRRE